MMLPSHIFLALLAISPVVVLFPEVGLLLWTATIIGAVLPDFDMVIGQHRKTLHFPSLALFVLPLSFLALLAFPENILISILSGFSIGFFLHPLIDISSSGLSERPWTETSEKCVYNHRTQSWVSPTRLTDYDGSPKDFAVLFLAVVVVFPLFQEIPLHMELSVLAITTGAIYVMVRKYLFTIEEFLYSQFPVLRPFLSTLHGRRTK